MSPATTGRRTPAAERPATGTAPSQGITKPPPGPVPCSSPARLLVEQLPLLHQSGRAPAAGGRPELAGSRARRRRGLQLLPAADGSAHHHLVAGPAARTPARDRRRARWRRSRSSRCICLPSTSASRPSRVRTASGWSACRSGCGPRNPNAHTFGPITSQRLCRRHHGHGDREGPPTSPGTWATAPRSSAIRRARRTSRSSGGRTPPTAATPTRSRARHRRMTPTPSPRPRAGSSPGRARARPGRSASTASTARPRSGSAKRRCS